jgi:ribonuclease HII
MVPQYLCSKEVGLDEAGRGSLIGPVFTAAVILPPNHINPNIKDSKKTKEVKREEIVTEIENDALDYSVGFADVDDIDTYNIKNAVIYSMRNCIDSLVEPFESIVCDGTEFNGYKDFDFENLKKGDDRVLSIAAASILAKYYRDKYICNEIDPQIPHFKCCSNKGYGTKEHRDLIYQYGYTRFHRKTFKPVSELIRKSES